MIFHSDPADNKNSQVGVGIGTPTPTLLPDKRRINQPCLECFKVMQNDAMLPKHVQKKHKLLKRFKKELSVSITEEQIPTYFQSFETIAQIKQSQVPIFVENCRIKKQAVIFWLSNSSVQINLSHCCVILSHRPTAVTDNSGNLMLRVWLFDGSNTIVPR